MIARIRRKYQLLVPEMDERRRGNGRRQKRANWAGAGCRWWPRPPACRVRRSRPACGNWIDRPRSVSPRRHACGGGERAGGLDGDRSGVAGGPGVADRTRDARRPQVPVALDLQEHPAPGRGIDAAEPSRRSPYGGRVAARSGIQPAGQPQDAGRSFASGPQCPVRVHQRQVARFLHRGQPAISVDTKKKELVGDFKNGGREWQPQGEPEEVRVHDFLDKTLGKAIPYGVYDMINNQGWVSVGIDHDTAQFAANSIRRWWHEMGRRRFPKASELLITADGGGSNSHRSRLVEGVAAGTGRRTGADAVRLPLPAGHQQVEQDRASAVQLHHPELARPAAGQPPSDRQPDRQHHDADGSDREGGPGHQPLRHRDQSQRRGTRGTAIATSRVPWRLELHDLAATKKL